MKHRGLGWFLSEITRIEKVRSRFYRKYWVSWMKRAQGKWCGKHGDGVLIFDVNKEAYSLGSATGPTEMALVATEEELPLLIGNSFFYDQGVIEKRFKGEMAGIPHRQDLADEFQRIETRSKHHLRAKDYCTQGVFSIISRDLCGKKNRIKRLIVLRHRGKTFYVSRDGVGYKFITESEIKIINL